MKADGPGFDGAACAQTCTDAVPTENRRKGSLCPLEGSGECLHLAAAGGRWAAGWLRTHNATPDPGEAARWERTTTTSAG